jgi:Na+-driven multidrug efflux pump
MHEGSIELLILRLALPTAFVLVMSTALSIAETYFVSTLGADAVAAVSLVLPFFLFMTIVSSGVVRGSVSSAIARALGAGRQEEAESLLWHALLIALIAGTT